MSKNLTQAKAHPAVHPSLAAAIGYCFGGQCCLDMVRNGDDLQGVVSLHGLLQSEPHNLLEVPHRRWHCAGLCVYSVPWARSKSPRPQNTCLSLAESDPTLHTAIVAHSPAHTTAHCPPPTTTRVARLRGIVAGAPMYMNDNQREDFDGTVNQEGKVDKYNKATKLLIENAELDDHVPLVGLALQPAYGREGGGAGALFCSTSPRSLAGATHPRAQRTGTYPRAHVCLCGALQVCGTLLTVARRLLYSAPPGVCPGFRSQSQPSRKSSTSKASSGESTTMGRPSTAGHSPQACSRPSTQRSQTGARPCR